jgi:hypothetical protein
MAVPGLDPGVHVFRLLSIPCPSWPGLSRPSTSLNRSADKTWIPGTGHGDDDPGLIPGSSPGTGMTVEYGERWRVAELDGNVVRDRRPDHFRMWKSWPSCSFDNGAERNFSDTASVMTASSPSIRSGLSMSLG